MNPNENIHIDLPATHKYLNVLSASIQEMLARAEIRDENITIYSIQLAVQEACTNIIDHAYAGANGRIAITLTLASQPNRFIIESRDTGTHTHDPSQIDEPSPYDTRGRGWFLIRKLMDEITYHSRESLVWKCKTDGPWKIIKDTSSLPAPEGHNYLRLVKHL